MPTERQKIVVKKISENIRNKKIKNKGEILRESGYSNEVSKKPKQVLESKGVKEELKPFVDEMISERNRAIKAMKIKDLDKVQYEKLSDVIDKLTKNIQLLSGKETSIEGIIISEEETNRIKDIFK
jgi:hypothetical protein